MEKPANSPTRIPLACDAQCGVAFKCHKIYRLCATCASSITIYYQEDTTIYSSKTLNVNPRPGRGKGKRPSPTFFQRNSKTAVRSRDVKLSQNPGPARNRYRTSFGRTDHQARHSSLGRLRHFSLLLKCCSFRMFSHPFGNAEHEYHFPFFIWTHGTSPANQLKIDVIWVC